MSAGNGIRRGGPIVEVRLDKLFDRTPPHSPEAEMALLGAMILDSRVIADVIAIIKTPDVFYSEAHKVIYASMVELYDRKQAGNLVLLADLLRDKDALKDIGDKPYLSQLAASTPGPATAVHFARIVVDKAKLRRLIEAGGQTVYDAYHSGDTESVREIIDKAESRIFEIAQEEETSAAESLAVLVQREYDRLEALHGKGISGIPTGYHDLDELTSGLQKGEMIIVAARPSMGKTALALNLAEQIALGGAPFEKRDPGRKNPVGIFSLEMSKSAIALRMLSARSGISSHEMRSGRMQPDQYDRLLTSCGELHEAPIYVDDTPGLTILGLRTRARRMVSQHGVRCIVIDYLQLMTAPNAARESRQVEVSAISRGVKALARELDVPVICLSQLNRGPESRGDNRPRMSDLRESGSIEQDADVVALLHREDYYHVGDEDWLNDPANEDKIGIAEIIIAKQRNGPTDVVKLKWDNTTTRFKNLAKFGGGYDGGFGGGGFGGGGGGFGGGGGGGGFGGGRGGGSGGTGGAGGGGGDYAHDDPFRVQVVPFSPGKKTGPAEQFRDGGGPDRDDEEDGGMGLPV